MDERTSNTKYAVSSAIPFTATDKAVPECGRKSEEQGRLNLNKENIEKLATATNILYELKMEANDKDQILNFIMKVLSETPKSPSPLSSLDENYSECAVNEADPVTRKFMRQQSSYTQASTTDFDEQHIQENCSLDNFSNNRRSELTTRLSTKFCCGLRKLIPAISFMLLSFVLIFAILIYYSMFQSQNSPAISIITAMPPIPLIVPKIEDYTKDLDTCTNEKENEVHLSASSVQKFQRLLQQTSEFVPITLRIRSSSHEKWIPQNKLVLSGQVRELIIEQQLDAHVLTLTLQTFRELRRLTIHVNSFECNYDGSESRLVEQLQNITLSKLSILRIVGPGCNKNILEIFSKFILLPRLRVFACDNGHLSKISIEYIRGIITTNRKSVGCLQFSNMITDDTLFDQGIRECLNVKSIEITNSDFSPEAISNGFVNGDICHIFPNLEKLTVLSGLRGPRINTQNCTHLKYLDITY